MQTTRAKHESALDQGREVGTTYFSYGGLTTLDTAATTSPVSGKRNARKKDTASVHSSYSDRGDTELSTIPARSRTFLDPSGLMLMSSPLPMSVGGHSRYTSMSPTFIPFDGLIGEPPENMLLGRLPSRHRGVHQPRERLRNLVILVASLFTVALVVVIFTAVYFGHGFESRLRR